MARDIEALTRKLLKAHDVVTPPVPVDHIAQVEGLSLAYHDLEDDVSGMLIRHGSDPAIVAINVHHHENRQRFSIAHELGHYLMHQGEPTVFVDDYLVHFRAGKSDKIYDTREKEANIFAASLLMPKTFLQADLKDKPIDISDDESVRALARRYGVSVQALTIRLANLGFVSSI